MKIIFLIFYLAIFIVIMANILLSSVKLVPQSSVGIIFRFGKFLYIKNTGIYIILPIVDKMILVNLTEQLLQIDHLKLITRDKQSIKATIKLKYQVYDPLKICFGPPNHVNALEQLITGALNNIAGGLDLRDISPSPEIICSKLQTVLNETTDWGITINMVEFNIIS